MQKPVVVTSINPFSRLTHQMRCFQAWTALGFDVHSINTKAEIKELTAAGLPEEAILNVKKRETGAVDYGKAVPRIRPLLNRLQLMYPQSPIVLVNSDIYPAIRDTGFVNAYLSDSPAVALCREETSKVEATEFVCRRPYRGGLDIFMISPLALRKINTILSQLPVAARMCFGVPGWDYLMGSVICSREVGGAIMDSGLLLHESHPQAYGEVDELHQYVPVLKELGTVQSDNYGQAAAEFAQKIRSDCDRYTGYTNLIRATYYRQPGPTKHASPEALRICRRLCDMLPWAQWNYNFYLMANLAEAHLHGAEFDFSSSSEFFVRSQSTHHRFAETLLAILFELMCKPGLAANTSDTYPANNRHSEAVMQIRTNMADAPANARLEFAQLFGRELLSVDTILNDRLYDYLCLACQNDYERALIAGIGNLLRSVRHAA